MSDLIKQAGFDDDAVPSSRPDNYKAKEGKQDRIAMAWVADEISKKTGKRDPQFIFAPTFYVPGNGYILAKPGFDKLIGKQPKKRFATVVIVYQTDKEGELFKDEDGKPILSYSIKPWFFSEQKYRDLKSLHNKWDLSKHDLDISCIEEQYQNITIQPHPNSYLEKMMQKEKYKEKLMAQIEATIQTLPNSLGRDLTEEELREDVLEEEEQSVTDDSTEEFSNSDSDEIMNDILDDIE